MCCLNSRFAFAGFNALVLAGGYTELICCLLDSHISAGTHGFETDGLDVRILFGLAMIITKSKGTLQLNGKNAVKSVLNVFLGKG